MPSEEQVKDYILQQLATGKNILKIRQNLINANWSPAAVDKLLDEVLTVKKSQTKSKPNTDNFIHFWLHSISGIILHPNEFFQNLPELKFGKIILISLLNFLVPILVNVAITSLYVLLLPFLAFFVGFGIGISLLYVLVVGIPTAILSLFVGAAYLHLFVKLFKGKGTYKKSLEIVAFSSAASLLGLIPILGVIAAIIFTIRAQIKGIATLHQMTSKKAAIVLLTSWILPTILIGIYLLFVFLA